MIRICRALLIIAMILIHLQSVQAVEFMKKGAAIKSQLGTSNAFQNKVSIGKQKVDFFYSKDKGGKAEKLAVIQGGLYPPNCTHTWVIGLSATKCSVNGIDVVEMSCPHAFPTQKRSFTDQFTGKGPTDTATLSSKIATIAKATGSSELTTTAVKTAIQACSKVRGKI